MREDARLDRECPCDGLDVCCARRPFHFAATQRPAPGPQAPALGGFSVGEHICHPQSELRDVSGGQRCRRDARGVPAGAAAGGGSGSNNEALKADTPLLSLPLLLPPSLPLATPSQQAKQQKMTPLQIAYVVFGVYLVTLVASALLGAALRVLASRRGGDPVKEHYVAGHGLQHVVWFFTMAASLFRCARVHRAPCAARRPCMRLALRPAVHPRQSRCHPSTQHLTATTHNNTHNTTSP